MTLLHRHDSPWKSGVCGGHDSWPLQLCRGLPPPRLRSSLHAPCLPPSWVRAWLMGRQQGGGQSQAPKPGLLWPFPGGREEGLGWGRSGRWGWGRACVPSILTTLWCCQQSLLLRGCSGHHSRGAWGVWLALCLTWNPSCYSNTPLHVTAAPGPSSASAHTGTRAWALGVWPRSACMVRGGPAGSVSQGLPSAVGAAGLGRGRSSEHGCAADALPGVNSAT